MLSLYFTKSLHRSLYLWKYTVRERKHKPLQIPDGRRGGGPPVWGPCFAAVLLRATVGRGVAANKLVHSPPPPLLLEAVCLQRVGRCGWFVLAQDLRTEISLILMF